MSLTFYYDKKDKKEAQNASRLLADSGVYKDADWVEGYFRELTDVHMSMRWTAYTHTHFTAHKGEYINISENGTRRTWNSDNPSNGTINKLRIFFFGASTLWGVGSRDEHTIPSLVSKILAENRINAEVTSYAVSADVTTQSLLRFVFELRERNIPDLVVFYGGLVDASVACLGETPGTPLGNSYLERLSSLKTSKARLNAAISDYTKEGLSLVRFSKDVTSYLQGRPTPKASGCLKANLDDLSERNLNVYFKNIQFIETVSKQFSFDFIFYLEPYLPDKARRTPYEDEALTTTIPGRNDLYSLTRNKLLSREHEILGKHLVHDLHLTFSNISSPLYIDQAHYGEDANARISEAIAADILAIFSRGAGTTLLLQKPAVGNR